MFVVAAYPTKQRPLNGVFVRDHALAAAMNHNVRVIHLDWNGALGEDPVVPPPAMRFRYSPGIGQIVALTYFAIALFRLRISGYKPDLIHGQIYTVALHAWLASKIFRCPWVQTEHYSTFARGRVTGGRLKLVQWLYTRANRVLPVSENLQHTLEEHSINANYEIVWNSVDVDTFRVREASPPGDQLRLLSVGHLDAEDKKNVSGLLQALVDVPGHVSLTVVGDGPTRQQLEHTAHELGVMDRVHFRGAVGREEVATAMQEHHALVHPAHFETFSLVVGEALVSGLPVIATQRGAIPEMVNLIGGGVLVDGHGELVKAIRGFDPAAFDRKELARQARELLNPRRLATSLASIYDEEIN